VLIRTNKYLRNLFLAYPEACLQGTLQQHPHPVCGLIQTSWALYRHSHVDFNSQKAVALLGQYKVVEWSTLYPQILENDADSIEALEVLFRMCEDVHLLVEAYAQSTAAAIEQVVNPWVEYAPITLSITEFTRVASTFWMLSIFYQFQLLFAHHGTAQPSVDRFIGDLQPWQVQQCLSAELFLSSSGSGATSSVYTLIGDKYGVRSALSMTTQLFQIYREVTSLSLNLEIKWRLATFSHVNSIVARTCVPWLQIQPSLDVGVGREGFEHTTTHLRNDGWMLYELVRHINPVRSQQYHRLFMDLGILFWDLGRLVDWDFNDPDDFPSIVCLFEDRLKTMAMYRYRYTCRCCR
jgi:hypothetical protein